MAAKRMTLELPVDQYEFVRKQAGANGTTVSGFIRRLIEDCRRRFPQKARGSYKTDPFHLRRGSFDGPGDLAENHDRYLYGHDPL